MGGRRWIGPLLFAIYCIAYAAFVLTAAFATFSGGVATGGLAARGPGGLTWGVLGGFGLISGAFVLAVLYAWLGPSGHAEGDDAGGRG